MPINHEHLNDTMNINTEYMPEYLKSLYERRMEVNRALGAASIELTVANVNYNALILESITLNGTIVSEERRLMSGDE